MTRTRIRRVQGESLHAGDHFDTYPARFVGDTAGECCRLARCTDGTCERVRDHGWYRRASHPTIELPFAA